MWLIYTCIAFVFAVHILRSFAKQQAATAEQFYWGNLRAPRRVMSETPFDFTVSQRAETYRAQMKACGNQFNPPIIEYIYRAPLADKLDLSQDFLAWQFQVEADFRERAAAWMADKYKRVAPAANNAFAGQQYTDFETVLN